ncbi:hypothetical protein ACHHYP_03325 [Achlya hypogyna]|uniref:Uncharacterized protein n=1 Tax=Achlya hypogyna TaxID=1202772 RepID=A0A1V9Z3Z3_ACHHY|nr:hypothetical protein ACHHYP_03325 [Achlya hypogyna]
MVLPSKLLLPGRDRHGKQNKTPIVQLSATACLKWLNPRRAAAGLPVYANDGKGKPIPVTMDEPAVAGNNGNWTSHAATIRVTMRKLAQHNAIPFSDLWTASFHGRQTEVEHYIMACGMDANLAQFGYPNQTPLHFAVSGGAMQTVQFLISKAASVSKVDVNGNSSIHIASRWGRLDILEYFLRGPTIPAAAWSAPNRMGLSPRAMAAQHGHLGTVQFFDLHFSEPEP